MISTAGYKFRLLNLDRPRKQSAQAHTLLSKCPAMNRVAFFPHVQKFQVVVVCLVVVDHAVGLAELPRTRLFLEGRECPWVSIAVAWLNSPPLSAKSLRGKVVLIDFWTYSCINCLRALPYVEGWAAKYKDAGLVVIGVIPDSQVSRSDPGGLGANHRKRVEHDPREVSRLSAQSDEILGSKQACL